MQELLIAGAAVVSTGALLLLRNCIIRERPKSARNYRVYIVRLDPDGDSDDSDSSGEWPSVIGEEIEHVPMVVQRRSKLVAADVGKRNAKT